jgi:hypothetical protein
MAQEKFQSTLLQETSEDDRQSARQALLRYCERDTAALVRVVGRLSSI